MRLEVVKHRKVDLTPAQPMVQVPSVVGKMSSSRERKEGKMKRKGRFPIWRVLIKKYKVTFRWNDPRVARRGVQRSE